jgi:hypothetical protein
MNEEAIARVGPQRKKKVISCSYTSNEVNVFKAGAKDNAIHDRGGSKTHYWSIQVIRYLSCNLNSSSVSLRKQTLSSWQRIDLCTPKLLKGSLKTNTWEGTVEMVNWPTLVNCNNFFTGNYMLLANYTSWNYTVLFKPTLKGDLFASTFNPHPSLRGR